MNKSLRLIVLLLLFVFLIDRIVGFIAEKIYTQTPPRDIGALYHVINQENTYEQLVLGSSRALHGVIPELLTNRSFNLGRDGTAIDMHLATLKILESKKKLPKTILLNLDEKMVFNMGVEYVGIEKLSSLYSENDWVREQINKQSKYNSFLYLLKIYQFNGKIGTLLNPTNQFKNDSNEGFTPLNAKTGDSTRIETLIKRKIAIAAILGRGSSELNPMFVSNFMELVALANTNNIQLIVFSPPLYGPRDREPGKSKLYDLMCQMGITYLDYRGQLRIDQGIVSDIKFWKDLSHLNHEGAKVFTKRLNKDIEYLLSTNGVLPQELKICKE